MIKMTEMVLVLGAIIDDHDDRDSVGFGDKHNDRDGVGFEGNHRRQSQCQRRQLRRHMRGHYYALQRAGPDTLACMRLR